MSKLSGWSWRRRYWQSLDNVQGEVLEWVYLHGEMGRMPSSCQLRATGANSLQFAISAYHGGFKALAQTLGCCARPTACSAASHTYAQ